ncbi:MAG: ATP-binding cassette domain-containing protein [Spirochaetota bacterium]
MHNISISGVTYAWPGEGPVLQHISFNISRGIHAIAGQNGAGKTTLLRLIAGEIHAQSGSIRCDTTPRFVSFAGETLRRQSSGEQQMLLLETTLAQNTGIVLFDEPERHLDTENRQRFMRRLRHFAGTVILATHETGLLDLAESILHLENRSVALFRMPFAAYCRALEAERAERANARQRAEHSVKKSLLEAERDLSRQLKRERIAAQRAPTAGIPRIARGLMKRNAEKTRGRIIRRTTEQVAHELEKLSHLRTLDVRQPEFCFIPVAGEKLHAQLEIAGLNFGTGGRQTLWANDLTLNAKSGEKIRIAGRNGSGKSLLLKAICGKNTLPLHGSIRLRSRRMLLLDQDYSAIAPQTNLLDLAGENLPGQPEGEIRRMLGAYGFAGSAVFRDFHQLSSGERVRLLVLLLSSAENPPDVLMADEAETGLDRETRALFAQFLNQYPGLLLFTTHSDDFAAQVLPTRSIPLTRHRGLGSMHAATVHAVPNLRE